jgi:hypothetical protein
MKLMRERPISENNPLVNSNIRLVQRAPGEVIVKNDDRSFMKGRTSPKRSRKLVRSSTARQIAQTQIKRDYQHSAVSWAVRRAASTARSIVWYGRQFVVAGNLPKAR